MKTQTFVFLHDQDLLLSAEATGQFDQSEHPTYVFLGAGSTARIEDRSDVVICRNLPGHLEDYPRLTSFSGWYALWRNGLVEADYLNLFEYDVELSPDFRERLAREVEHGFSILGYVPFSVRHPLFIDDAAHIGLLLELIRVHHNMDAAAFIRGMDEGTTCSRTSNHTFRRDVFDQYMRWMEPMIDEIKGERMAGHHIERSISLFYLLNRIPDVRICEGIVHHAQANSHRTYPSDTAKPPKSGLVSRSIHAMGAWVRQRFL